MKILPHSRLSIGRLLVLLAVSALLCGRLQSAPAVSTNQLPAAGGTTNAPAIPPAEIATQAESASAALQTIKADLAAGEMTDSAQRDLAVLTGEISDRLAEESKMLSPGASLGRLRTMAHKWQDLHDELAGWTRRLKKRATQLEQELATLARLAASWEATRGSAQSSSLPSEVLQRVESVIQEVSETRKQADTQHAAVLTLQNRVTDQDAKIAQVLAAIEHAREEAVHGLFRRDNPVIWSAELRSGTPQTLAQESHHSFLRQWSALARYVNRMRARFFLHGVCLIGVVALLIMARRKLKTRDEKDGGVKNAALAFQLPVPTAIVLSLLASGWIYPEPPRLLWAILGAAALVPAAIVVRRFIDRRLLPVLNVLVLLYFADQLRNVLASQRILLRWLSLLEMTGAAVFALWFLKSGRLAAIAAVDRRRFWKGINIGVRVSLACFVLSVIANAAGFVGLSELIGDATLTSAYLALILYGAVRLAEGLIQSALSVPPLARLDMVNRHRSFLQAQALRVLGWSAILVWIIFVLETLSLRDPLFQDLQGILTAKLALGSFRFSFGDILLFGVTIWAALLISRILRFILQEEVYPRVHLAPGVHYSISTMLHYAILLVGFFVGIAMLGFDLTKLTILAGAFGVGLGFGLQNIINNFVSGIILLFERPIKVGDVVQLDSSEGVVQRIGIRASIIRTSKGSEIIVPNAKLISDTVTNLTSFHEQRMILIPLVVAPGPDASRVMELLKSTAVSQPLILKDPPPRVLLTNFTGGSLNFELRAWTGHANDWSQVRSDLSVAISLALTAQNISIR